MINNTFDYFKKIILSNKEYSNVYKKEIKYFENNRKYLKDSFSKDLFLNARGTRAIMGLATNQMNIFTVARLTQSICNYLTHTISEKKFKKIKVVVGYDTRLNSFLFAKVTSIVFAANNIKVSLFKKCVPTPVLSFAVINGKYDLGIVITASHNSKEYNGYKVYNNKGCQISDEQAKDINRFLSAINFNKDIKITDFKLGLKNKNIVYVDDKINKKYINTISKYSIYKDKKNINIVYSCLHGTGLKYIKELFKKCGYKKVIIVKEQLEDNGLFSTCAYPNPEDKNAMNIGMKYLQQQNADIFLATDPDADRVGVSMLDKNNVAVILNTNDVGCLLLNYLIKVNRSRKKLFCKTIVTTQMANIIAQKNNLNIKETLTGFKYIGEILCNKVDEKQFLFAFEESCGFLFGTHVRDKDGIVASLLIADMVSYYKKQGLNLYEVLDDLRSKYGYYNTYQKTYPYSESKLKSLHEKYKKISINIIDYNKGIDNLPKSNVIKYYLKNGNTVIVRPSGTEPKIKVYFCDKKFKII